MPRGFYPENSLSTRLEELRGRYETSRALAQDPLSIPLRYQDPMDRELAAWVAAHLAYGRVAPMLRAIEAVLAPLGPAPADRLRQEDPAAWTETLASWKWRFHTGSDMLAWLGAWRRLDRESGGTGLEAHLASHTNGDQEDQLSAVIQRLRRELPASSGLRFNLPDPADGGACKRWRMFLRWMVRRDWPDLGQWRSHSPANLIIPVDTHVARVSRFIGLTRRSAPDGRMAREITDSLKRWAPEDPLKYDFALSHLGILGDCPGRRTLPRCAACPLFSLCTAP